MAHDKEAGDGMMCGGGRSFCEMYKEMGDYAPDTLRAIQKLDPALVDTIRVMDKTMVSDGALDRKTKRLIALACVAVRMCDDCVYPQARVAKNYGATKEEILEAINVAVLTGGVPSWSAAKGGIQKLFDEWDDERFGPNQQGGTGARRGTSQRTRKGCRRPLRR